MKFRISGMCRCAQQISAKLYEQQYFARCCCFILFEIESGADMENKEDTIKKIDKVTETLIKELESLSEEGVHELLFLFLLLIIIYVQYFIHFLFAVLLLVRSEYILVIHPLSLFSVDRASTFA